MLLLPLRRLVRAVSFWVLVGAIAFGAGFPVSVAEATTLGYFRAEDGPGSSHSTWVNSANVSTPGTSTGGSPVQNSTEVFGSVVPLTGAANTGSYYLDGTNAIQIGTGAGYNIGTGDFTVEFWFKTSGSSAAHPIVVSKASYANSDLSWGVSIEDHNRDYIGGGIAPGTGGSVGGLIPEDIVDGTWHHFAMVLDRSSAAFREYLDGEHRVTDNWLWGGPQTSPTLRVPTLVAETVPQSPVISSAISTKSELRRQPCNLISSSMLSPNPTPPSS